jgi:polar amino acid transport system substrate-binding protein
MKRITAISLALLALAISAASAGASSATRAKPASSQPVIRIATEVGYAPYEVYAADGKTLQGLDVDLWTALAKVLHVKFTVQDGTYANIIPSLESKRADVGWSAMALSSFVGLKQAKFLVYERRSFSGVVVKSDSTIKTGTNLCGQSLGFTNGEAPPIQSLQTTCKQAGKPGVQIKRFQKTPDIILAVESGQVGARIVDSVNGNYFVKQSHGKLKFVPNVLPIHWIPTGIAIPVGQDALLKEFQTGLQKLVDNGTYGKIFTKWGAAGTEVKKITVAYRYAG